MPLRAVETKVKGCDYTAIANSLAPHVEDSSGTARSKRITHTHTGQHRRQFAQNLNRWLPPFGAAKYALPPIEITIIDGELHSVWLCAQRVLHANTEFVGEVGGLCGEKRLCRGGGRARWIGWRFGIGAKTIACDADGPRAHTVANDASLEIHSGSSISAWLWPLAV